MDDTASYAQGHWSDFGTFVRGARLPCTRSATSYTYGTVCQLRQPDDGTVHRPHRPERSGNEYSGFDSSCDTGSGSLERRGALALPLLSGLP